MASSKDPQPRLVFFHTAEAHCRTFRDLMRQEAPKMRFAEIVDEAILRDVMAEGELTPALERRLTRQLEQAGEMGAEVVLCSCSTLGGPAETLGRRMGFTVLRIDRGMAEAAVQQATDILVLACIDSTLAPTLALLKEVAGEAGSAATLRSELIGDAWADFLAGDQDAYLAKIASVIEQRDGTADVIVLAQASMAGAIARCKDLQTAVLSSSRLGLRRALAALGSQ